MHPYVIDRMVQERRDELSRLARAARVEDEGRPVVRRALAALGTALATRVSRRPPAQQAPAELRPCLVCRPTS